MTEAQIQTSIRNVLTTLGYTVVEIGRTRRMVPCRRCGAQTPAIGWQGNTPGAPDLMVTTPRWGALWIGIECKRPGGAIRPEQRKLLDAGSTTIARSVRDALEAIMAAETRLGYQSATVARVVEQLIDQS